MFFKRLLKRKPSAKRTMRLESLETRRLMAADPIKIGVVYLETDYLELDQDNGNDSRGDRFLLEFSGGAAGTELSELRINTDKDSDGITIGDLIFDTAAGGRGKGGFHPFSVQKVETTDGTRAEVTATIADGGTEMILQFRNFKAGDRLEFTIDLDEVLRLPPDLATFNSRLDVIASGQEFHDSILQATFTAPNYFAAKTNDIFENDFGNPWPAARLDLPPDEGPTIDSRPNRSAAALGTVQQRPVPASVSGFVYRDDNDSGTKDAGEIGLSGVRVRLEPISTIEPQTPLTTTTLQDGSYRFEGVIPGRYRIVELNQPAGLADGRDAAGTISGRIMGSAVNPGDEIRDVILAGGDAGINYNFGELPLGSIAGFVYLAAPGADCEGDHEVGDSTPLANVEIRLQDRSGRVVATTRTINDGSYRFNHVLPGIYDIVEVTPSGLLDGESHVGQMRTIASSLAVSVGSSVDGGLITNVALPPGGEGQDYNFCEASPGWISGNVYHDRDNDGSKDSGEEPISGVELRLINSSNATVATIRTGADGTYKFENLGPDTYRILETQPSGFIDGIDTPGSFSGVTSGRTGADGDSLVDIVLRQGTHGIDYNFGERQVASLAGRVHVDVDEDCVFDPEEQPLQGVTITLVDSTGRIVGSTTTDSNGAYRFENLVPGRYSIVQTQPTGYFEGGATPGSLGGRLDGPNRIEEITLQSGENGVNYDFCERPPAEISGVVYVDRDADCFQDDDETGLSGVLVELFDSNGDKVGSTTTDSNGFYRFTNLIAGTYTVRESQPLGYFQGGQKAGSHGGDDSVADVISSIPLGWGQTLTRYDFCERLPAGISGVVYVDRNADCVQDAGEEGLAGVIVELFDEAGNKVASTTTSADGSYQFNELSAGNYTIRELQPAGYFQGGQKAGSGGGDDSVADVISSVRLGWGETLTRYDFCELLPSTLAGRVYSDFQGNRRFDDGDRGLPNVVVELVDASEIVVATTTTDSTGRYQFFNLPPGVYEVREQQPDGFFHGGQTLGNLGGVVVADDRLGSIVLTSGVDGIDYDFPEVPPATIAGYVFQDGDSLRLTVAPDPKRLRDFLDGKLTDDDTRLSGVELELRNVLGQSVDGQAVGLPGLYASGPIVRRTNLEGYYEFTGLRPGATYAVYQVQPGGFIDSLDTPGGGGATAVNEADLADADGNIKTQIQRLSNDPTTDPKFDAILNIFVMPGQSVVGNNFSEFLIDPPPPDLPPPQAPPTPSINRPVAPIESFAAVRRPMAFWSPLNARSPMMADDEWAVSWHLSVINGGYPRGEAPVEGIAKNSTSDGPIVRRVGVREDGSVDEAMMESKSGLPDELLRRDLIVGHWRVQLSTTRTLSESTCGESRTLIGHDDATALTGDFDGDGIDEAVLFIGGQWFVDLNGNGVWDRGDLWIRLGTELDRPVAGDWDGDGKDDVAIFGRRWHNDEQRIKRDPGLPDPANTRRRDLSREDLVQTQPNEDERRHRWLLRGKDGGMRADAIDHVFQYGEQVDTPLAGDWNGDGIDQIGIFRQGQWMLDEDGDGRWTKQDKPFTFGEPGDDPVVGDFDGDGIDEIGVVRGDLWIIDSDGDRRLTANDRQFKVAREDSESQPIVGDFDGDKIDDPGYYSVKKSGGA